MNDEARIETAKEIFHKSYIQVLKGKPADSVVSAEIRNRRYIGSSDRRYITNLIWKVFRNLAKALFFLQENGIEISSFSLFDAVLNEKYGDLLMPSWAEYECPEHLFSDFKGIEQSLLCMNRQASVDLRVNSSKTTCSDMLSYFNNMGVTAQFLPFSPDGIRLCKRVNLQEFSVFKEGKVWPQDEGSQVVSRLIAERIAPYSKVLDLCAGAGGKTLALYDILKGKADITATDVSRERLSELTKRVKVIEFYGIKTKTLPYDYKPFILEQAESFDVVLVDAPCSGTGTWRRAPDAKWRTTQEMCLTYQKTQQDILCKSAKFVKKGGMLSYVTCSLRKQENEIQIQQFLDNNRNFAPVEFKQDNSSLQYPKDFAYGDYGVYILPEHWNTDGFFISFLKKEK